MRAIPNDQFAAWWRAARTVAEVVERACEAVGWAVPRWAVVARAVAGRKGGLDLPPLPDEAPAASRRGEPEHFDRTREVAEGLLRRHGLAGWRFGFNANVRRAGVCKYPTRTKPGRIELSRHFVLGNPDAEVLDTILHEIAHALVGPDHGHDAVWRAKCVEIGARPERCYGHHVVMPKGKWRAACPACGRAFDRHRRPTQPTGWHCRACGKDRGQLVWRAAIPSEG